MTAQLRIYLRRSVWDYDISEDALEQIFEGKKEVYSLDQYRLRARLFLSVPWYKILEAAGVEAAKGLLADQVIAHIRIKDVRDKMLSAREVLNG